MNWKQFYYNAGIGSEYKVVFRKGGLIKDKLILISIAEDTLYFRESFGSLFSLKEGDEADVFLVKGRFLEDNLKSKVEDVKKKCNKVGGHLSIFKCFEKEIQEATELLKSAGTAPAQKLAELISTETVIREHRIDQDELEDLNRTACEYLDGNPDVCAAIRFLIHYSAYSYSGAMKVMTDMLDQGCGSSVYRLLGLVNLYLGKAEAMYLYWMGKYFLQSPERILADNECGCDPDWIRYLDTCGNLICYKNLDEILAKLMTLGEKGNACAYFSLTRLFQRAGFFTLACEAVSYFSEDEEDCLAGRPANELVKLLRTDEDSYCCFVMKAADAVLAAGLEDYTKPDTEDRMGYLYDFANGRHYGRVLGFDMLTYFFAASNIPENRRKQFNRSADFSTYQSGRPLSRPVRFKANEYYNSGSYAIDTFY